MRARREGSGEPGPLARLSEVVRAATSGDVAEGAGVAARARFLATLGRWRRKRPRPNRMAWGGAGLLAAGAAACFVQRASTGPEIARRAARDDYVSGGLDAGPTVRFSGGSSVELAAESRARVGDREADRARIVLEAGRAKVRGASHPFHDVLVAAGPYAVLGQAAEFDVSWSGDAIEVRVDAGAVTITGPAVGQGLTVHGGQSFAASDTAWELGCF